MVISIDPDQNRLLEQSDQAFYFLPCHLHLRSAQVSHRFLVSEDFIGADVIKEGSLELKLINTFRCSSGNKHKHI